LRAHAFDTGTNADVNHARLDGIGDIHHSLQATGALAIQASHSSGLWEPGNQRRGTELGGAASRGQHGAHSNIIDKLRVDATAADQALESTNKQVRGRGVFESALAAFCDGRAEGGSHDDVVGVLLCDVGLLAREMGRDLSETLLSYGSKLVVIKHVVAI
jgi:hypothetical protein